MNDFKRDMYYQVKQELSNKNIVFLLGPRKCGKTFVLKQLDRDLDNTTYLDFKEYDNKKSKQIIDTIISDINNGIEKLYLVDESTYIFFPEEEISRIANAYTDAKVNQIDVKTKIVFTGSQSLALNIWGSRAFCNQASYIKTNFLTYPEWLHYKNIKDINENTYKLFLQGTFDFYEFSSIKDYLQGCLDETIISNTKSRNYIYGNNCDLVDVDTLIDIMYLSMFYLHNSPSAQQFFKNNNFENTLKYISKDDNYDDMLERFKNSFVYKYDHIKALDIDIIKQCYSFLIRNDLIVATPIFSDFTKSVNVLQELERDESIYNKKDTLFKNVNFTITYPMFYVELLKEFFGEYPLEQLSRTNYLVGSIIECHIRGLLTSVAAFEYRNETSQSEIDYVNLKEKIAIEFTISDKKLKNVHLEECPSDYQKILLTKDNEDVINDIIRIPYYDFIYNMSDYKYPNLTNIKVKNINRNSIDVTDNR